MKKKVNAKEFKKMLFEGAVRFSFVKRDGTVEENRTGTMCATLLPKTEPIVARYLVKNIVWDFDNWGEGGEKGRPPRLRKSCIVCLTQADIDKWGADAMDNVIEEALEKKRGFAVKNFEYYELDEYDEEETRKLPVGSILFYDLERGGFRSLREDGLLSYQKA